MRQLSVALLLHLGVLGCALTTTPARLAGQVAATDGATVPAPQTRAGRVLTAWLSAVNDADSVRLAALQRAANGAALPNGVALRSMSGGLALTQVVQAGTHHVEFVLRDRGSAVRRFGVLAVAADDSARIAYFNLVALPPTASVSDLLVTEPERARIVTGTADNLRKYYVIPETGRWVADSLEARFRRGAYDGITASRYLADMLTNALRALSGDRHLRVDFSVPVLPTDPSATRTAADREQQQILWNRNNCVFIRAERPEDNVGYLKLSGFGPLEYCKATADAAMAFVKGTDALIVDLRDNNGGSPDLVTYLASYFFASRTLLATTWTRASEQTDSAWTTDVAGPQFAESKPVYVLTSKRTFSAGEAFPYQLQQLKRVSVVGDPTGGGAHPTWARRVADHFFVNVPGARVTSPVSGTDWEGRGVLPDISAPEVEALEVARRLAAAHLRKR
ncbi:MAG: S41 family peptidase [Gemmatimonadaceae bacterium]|nr:S41 family peptidase [Gemmatimonadaceae bacterium]